MTQADNHATLMQCANNGSEFERALGIAKNESIAEEYGINGALEALGYPDGSRLTVDIATRSASEA